TQSATRAFELYVAEPLDPVAVEAPRWPALTAPSIAEARAELHLTPGGVETIDAARYRRGRASTFEDTFQLSPGLIAQSRFGSDEARLSIRGSGLQRTFHGRGVRVLQDGVPINLADGGFDMQAIEPLSSAYINVWRGGNALATGASTLGGAIDYVSFTGRNAPRATVRAEVGSWDYHRLNVALAGARETIDAFASLTQSGQEGFRDHATQRNTRLFANVGYRWADDVETRVYLAGVISRSALPGSLTRHELQTDPRRAAAGSVALDQRRDFELLRLASRTAWKTGQTEWDVSAAWTTKRLDHPIFQVIDQDTDDFLARIGLTHTGAIGEHAHQLRAGLLFNRGTIAAQNFANVAGQRGARLAAADQTATNLEAFVESHTQLGRGWTAVLGVSAAANQRENSQRFGAMPDYSVRYERLMPKLGVRWDARELQVFANVSSSYEPPSFSEALTLNTARDAQTAWTIEAGTRGTRGAARWDLTLYHAKVNRELLTLDHDNNPSTAAATVNADETIHRGVEFGGEIDLWRGAGHTAAEVSRVVVRGAWTCGDFRFDDDPRYGNNRLAGLPTHLLRSEITWEHLRGWYAGITGEWVPTKTWIDFRNTFAADPYTIVGWRCGGPLGPRCTWFLDLRNLTDRRYASTTGVIEDARGLDQPQFLPGDGRSLFGGFDFRW
ncbi:MAG TPA: TonB-dependent receptor, partial [Candidatus Synoicihabitans sp.]|nr:TonB-dependent receptor [Candidatus Synoicihabitans sp.]